VSIRCAVIFPGALGDFICFLPALLALRARHPGRMVLAAAPALLDLICVDEISTVSIHGREISEVFAPRMSGAPLAAAWLDGVGHVYSWTGFHDADFRRHLQEVSEGLASFYQFRGMRPGEHATQYYARCVGLQPQPIAPGVIRADQAWSAEFCRQHGLSAGSFLVLHPGSGSPKKNWRGFDAVARTWRQRHAAAAVVLCGPAEQEQGDAVTRRGGDAERLGDGVIVVDGLALQQVAALLRRSALYLGNDSGISHLAGAVGARGVVLFGPSDPLTWAPRSDQLRVLHAPEVCAGCGPDVFCVHRLPAEVVAQALAEMRS